MLSCSAAMVGSAIHCWMRRTESSKPASTARRIASRSLSRAVWASAGAGREQGGGGGGALEDGAAVGGSVVSVMAIPLSGAAGLNTAARRCPARLTAFAGTGASRRSVLAPQQFGVSIMDESERPVESSARRRSSRPASGGGGGGTIAAPGRAADRGGARLPLLRRLSRSAPPTRSTSTSTSTAPKIELPDVKIDAASSSRRRPRPTRRIGCSAARPRRARACRRSSSTRRSSSGASWRNIADPAFDALADELDRVADVAWDGYSNSRKSPRTRKAGPGFADPDYDLADRLDRRQGGDRPGAGRI